MELKKERKLKIYKYFNEIVKNSTIQELNWEKVFLYKSQNFIQRQIFPLQNKYLSRLKISLKAFVPFK